MEIADLYIKSLVYENVSWIDNPDDLLELIHNNLSDIPQFYYGSLSLRMAQVFNVNLQESDYESMILYIKRIRYKGEYYLSDHWLEEANWYRTIAKEGLDIYTGKKLNEEDHKKAIREYVNLYLGGWRTRQEGVIFDNWEHGEMAANLPYIYGLDFGVNDPDALVKVAINEREKKIYIEECIYKNGLSTDELFDMVQVRCNKSLIVADLAGKRTILDFKKRGLSVTKCRKGSGSVVEGIKLMKSYTLVVNGANITKELNNYVWATGARNEVPIDAFNHAIDAARYAITHLLRKTTGVRI